MHGNCFCNVFSCYGSFKRTKQSIKITAIRIAFLCSCFGSPRGSGQVYFIYFFIMEDRKWRELLILRYCFVIFFLCFSITVSLALFLPNGLLHDIKYNENIQSGSCDVFIISNVTLFDHVYTASAIFTWEKTNHSDLVELQCDASNLACFENLQTILKTKRSTCYLYIDGHLSPHKNGVSYTQDIILMVFAGVFLFIAMTSLVEVIYFQCKMAKKHREFHKDLQRSHRELQWKSNEELSQM